MEKDNVYVLFEEIKNKIEMINGKLEQKTETPTDGQAEEVIPTCVRHIHRHSFDIRSSKVFSLLVGMGVVCSRPYGEISDFGSPTGNMQTTP